MRVVIVQPHLRAGGSEMQTLLLSNELVQLGIETHIVLHRAEGEFLKELDPAIHIHDLGVESHALIPLIAVRLDRVLGAFEDGLIIVKLWSSLLAVQLAATRRNKLIFAFYEDLDPLEHWRHIKLGRLKRRLIGPIFRHRTLVLANAERVADSMVQAYSLKRRPLVLHGGIDASRVRTLAQEEIPTYTSASCNSGKPMRIVTVGSLRQYKGHGRVLSALTRIDQPWQWHIVGDGPEAETLRSQIPNDFVDRVYFHGAVSNPYPFIHAADVMVHLPYSEAFGIVILEALALGVPVVSSPSIGPHEISARIDPENRYLRFVEPSDSPAVARAICEASLRLEEEIPRSITDPFTVTSTAKSWLSLAHSESQKRMPIL